MDTEEFIDTLNSILGIDLWPSVRTTLSRHGLTSDAHLRKEMVLVDLKADDLLQSVADFLYNKEFIPSPLKTVDGETWYVIRAEHKSLKTGENRYKIGYWDGVAVGAIGSVGAMGNGGSFDLNIAGTNVIYLNINHRKPWLTMRGDLYIFEPSSIKHQFLNWLDVNPLGVKE